MATLVFPYAYCHDTIFTNEDGGFHVHAIGQCTGHHEHSRHHHDEGHDHGDFDRDHHQAHPGHSYINFFVSHLLVPHFAELAYNEIKTPPHHNAVIVLACTNVPHSHITSNMLSGGERPGGSPDDTSRSSTALSFCEEHPYVSRSLAESRYEPPRLTFLNFVSLSTDLPPPLA